MDKVIGVAAIALLAGFMGILVGFVPDIDLVIVVAVVVAMAGYDFYRSLFAKQDDRQ
ncbi:hypothetical protein GCM10017083_25750 [Thalassobaculum fulvum]|uniref:Uncharacterized protein n=1 Tax=Thalassobaculum fulvum TaxID=1633335 RepID=A0A918XS33_9PROT|nr:hypothetical protein [Thalassobaculum fulvum]GHD51369.1 hypothetical protein GCM10017083_25750 [Thalassobaculum fulvum]